MRSASATPAIGPIAEKVAGALAGRRVLLLLDNVEQVVDAAPELSALLAESAASVLATSRILLRVRGEQNVPLGPLRSPEAGRAVRRARAGGQARLRAHRRQRPAGHRDLRGARQRAARPRARRGAAARADAGGADASASTTPCPCSSAGRATSPNGSARCEPPSSGARSCSRTASGNCCCASGVFRAGFGLDAVEWMSEGLSGVDDAVEALGALVDGSLVREQDRGSRAWFTMLATVREYGRDRLAEQGRLAEAQERHAGFYVGLAAAAGSAATWQRQVERVTRLARRARRAAGRGRPPLRDADGSTPSPSWRGRSTRSGGAAAAPARSGRG